MSPDYNERMPTRYHITVEYNRAEDRYLASLHLGKGVLYAFLGKSAEEAIARLKKEMLQAEIETKGTPVTIDIIKTIKVESELSD